MSEIVKKTSTFTPEQELAIASLGRTIVSASAGSGKTTVMIEKIIRFIKDGGNVSEILAVTFTKKAASQMKEKLRKALVEAINDTAVDGEKQAALKKQLDEVQTADISTIHSFCAKLLRVHFYAAGVDNAFRVIGGDDADGTAIKNEALDELLDEAYEQKDEAFTHLLSVYWRKKSDNTLRKILLSTYEQLRNRADYRQYLTETCEKSENAFDSVCADLLTLLKGKAAYYQAQLEEEQAYFDREGGVAQLKLCSQLYDSLLAIETAADYFAASALEKPAFVAKRTSKTDSDERRLHIERLAAIKEKVVKIYDDELGKNQPYEDEKRAYLNACKTARALATYLLRFDEIYERRKLERGVLDYNDLEHKALALLKDEQVAQEIRGKYRYVFVDEYQDVNPVQEALISRISTDNLFLVGDVKQSIYGFRGSKSKFFVEKQKRFAEGEGNNLIMTNNFRSSDAVLDAVNVQFSKAMTPQTCDVDYARDSYMKRGGRYALNDGRVCLHAVGEEPRKQAGKRGIYSVKERAEIQEKEASLLAQKMAQIIKDECNKTWYDADAKETRRVQYSDIVILSRKKQGKIVQTIAALSDMQIPVTAAVAVNICEFSEIKTLIDILSLIDNGAQDIPLCSALLSAMGNLTADDLAKIRLAYKDEKFFRGACAAYAKEQSDVLSHKLRRFFEYLDTLRTLSCVMSAGELLTKILTETRMEARLLARENGEACLRRVHRLIEETSVDEPLGVHAFLQRLRDLNYKIEYHENGGENAVKVLTMHASKGLEFPVVIIDDLCMAFHGADHDEVLIEEKYGLAPCSFNEENMTKQSTLLRRLSEQKQTQSTIADELNLYYVALTRAKYALHVLYKKESVVQDVRYARSFADFTDFSLWRGYKVDDTAFEPKKEERQALVFNPNEPLARDIIQAFQWEYPFIAYGNLPLKSSATRLMDSEAKPYDEREELFAAVEEIESEGGDALAKERGLAYHAFLEHFDFSALLNKDGNTVDKDTLKTRVNDFYSKLVEQGALIRTDLLDVEKLTEILSNKVFYTLQDAILYKEQTFLVGLPVKETYAKYVDKTLLNAPGEEEMLFQGAIDLLAVFDDGAWIIDYKYSGKDAEGLRDTYTPQLALYRMATAKILRLPLEKVRCSIVNIKRGFQVDLF